MSFSGEVKKELLEQVGKAKHCKIAELAALFSVCGSVVREKNGANIVKFATENLTVAKKYYILVCRVFYARLEMTLRGRHQYALYLLEEEDVAAFMEVIRFFDSAVPAADGLIKKPCCKRAFLRGIFLASGSVTNPNRQYHLELVAGDRGRAVEIKRIMGVFGLDAKIVERKKNTVVYIKEGSGIADFLNVIGAHMALMEFENVRILKEVRNSVNRQVNCETANIKKAVSASARQTEDIRFIHDTAGFGILSENLRSIARLRLDNPEVPLKELGEMLEPPIGKSGVNHRLRKLSEIAANLRKEKHEYSNGGSHD